jgi:hypothetical protein
MKNFFLFCISFSTLLTLGMKNVFTAKNNCIPHPGTTEICDSIRQLYHNDAICIALTECQDYKKSIPQSLVISDSVIDFYTKILCGFYNNVPDSLHDLRKIHFDYPPNSNFKEIVISFDFPEKAGFDPANGKFGPPALDSILKKCGVVYQREKHSSDEKNKAEGEMPEMRYNFYYFQSEKIINGFLLQSEVEKISPFLNAWGVTQISRDRGAFEVLQKNGNIFLQVYELRWELGGNYSLKRRTFDVTKPEKPIYTRYFYPATFCFDN